MSSDLPDRPNLEHLRKQARRRLRELQVSAPATQLADAQHAIAREYGFPSWPKLKAHLDSAMEPIIEGRAIAVHLTVADGGLFGVALLVPSERRAATLIKGTDDVLIRKLTPAMWREIERWVVRGNDGLPAQPPPLNPSVVARLFDGQRPAITGRRVASFPMNRRAGGDLVSTVKRLLPRLLSDATR